VFAPISVGSAIAMLLQRNAVHAALFLVVNFFTIAVFYLVLGASFLFAVQIIVYAGAIMVLFLFVIMLLNLGDEAELERHAGLSLSGRRLFVAGTSAALLGLVGLAAADATTVFAADTLPEGRALDDLSMLARLLFSRYMLPFEAASLLLLATMVAVIVLAKRERQRTTPSSASGPLTAARQEPVESGAPR